MKELIIADIDNPHNPKIMNIIANKSLLEILLMVFNI